MERGPLLTQECAGRASVGFCLCARGGPRVTVQAVGVSHVTVTPTLLKELLGSRS